MAAKPIIGITVESQFKPEDPRSMGEMKLNWNYAQAIADAGGVPIIIPPTADAAAISQIIHGWLIPGGSDIDAVRYGQSNHEKAELQDPARFGIESALYEALDANAPILGICYGCQFLNVIRGGTLHQHIPDLLGGDERHAGGTLEPTHIECASKLHGIVKTEAIAGKSYHHQAIDRVGTGLAVSGRHDDGTVEAIEAVDRPWVIGVQWHPERTLDDPPTRALFLAFIAAAQEFAAQKASPVSA
jgi:gamma-glutamyl-gamma-aminobutyrate hydrolase PuuD